MSSSRKEVTFSGAFDTRRAASRAGRLPMGRARRTLGAETRHGLRGRMANVHAARDHPNLIAAAAGVIRRRRPLPLMGTRHGHSMNGGDACPTATVREADLAAAAPYGAIAEHVAEELAFPKQTYRPTICGSPTTSSVSAPGWTSASPRYGAARGDSVRARWGDQEVVVARAFARIASGWRGIRSQRFHAREGGHAGRSHRQRHWHGARRRRRPFLQFGHMARRRTSNGRCRWCDQPRDDARVCLVSCLDDALSASSAARPETELGGLQRPAMMYHATYVPTDRALHRPARRVPCPRPGAGACLVRRPWTAGCATPARQSARPTMRSTLRRCTAAGGLSG